MKTKQLLSLGKRPVVSVVTATYNRAHFLREFLESIEKQTYPHWEAVIVDNNSHDETPDLVKEFAVRYPKKVQYIRLSDNLGFTPAIEEGFRRSSGELLMFMGDDDLILPQMLERSVPEFKRNPRLGLVYTNLWHGEKPEQNQYFPSSYRGVHDRVLSPEEFLDMKIHGKIICAQAAVFRKDVYESLGGFKDYYMQDTDFFFRLSTNYEIVYVPHILAFGRKHEGNLTNIKYEEFSQARLRYWKEKINEGDVSFQRKLKKFIFSQYIRHAQFYLQEERFNHKLFRKNVYGLFHEQKLHTSLKPYYYFILATLPPGLCLWLKKVRRRLYH